MDLIDLFKKEYNKNAIDIGVTGTELAKQRKNFQPMAEENEKKKKTKPQDFLKDKNDLKDILMLVKNKKLSANKLKSIAVEKGLIKASSKLTKQEMLKLFH